MKKLLLILMCFSTFFIGCVNSPSNKLETSNNEIIIDKEGGDNWSEREKSAFLNQCLQGASSNLLATESQIKNFCDCCLEEMILKYDSPTSDMDMKWFQVTSTKCKNDNINVLE
jgi:hypothetical protein|tara:strand:+ start:61 stop:402 length:342 start_codon:yes stop_codon:yes gene_type:complete